jgi:hypothetical protein
MRRGSQRNSAPRRGFRWLARKFIPKFDSSIQGGETNAMKRLSRMVFFLLVFFLAMLSGIIPSGLLAQTSNGTIAGSVLDPNDAVIPKAEIKVASPQFGAVRETQTDSAGTYRLESLQPGVYEVTISAPGFAALVVSNVTVNGSVTTTVNGKLQLATTHQTIEIQAPASQVIDTQSGQLGGTLVFQELTQLPIYSLNPAELAFTLPGVHDTPQGAVVNTAFTDGVAFSVNGTRPRANNFLIDGQDNNDYGVGGQAFQPTNLGAIQEVTILTNAYGAEFGRGGGSVTNYIYKSGTNRLHGDLWEINRNSALAAIPAQDAIANTVTSNPFDNENTFGFDMGGPLLKDKLFFFGAAQWDRERQSATGPVLTLPTAAGIATLQSSFPNNANVNLLLSSIGSLVSPGLTGLDSVSTGLNGAGPFVETGFFQVQNVAAAANYLDWNYRMDWHFTDRDTLTGSMLRDSGAFSPDIIFNADALPNFQSQQAGTSDIFRAQWVHTISSTLVNELRLSYASIDFAFDLTPAAAANSLVNTPFISFGTDINFPSIGVNSSFPQGRAHQTWQLQEGLSHAAGKHSIKAGFDLTVLSVNDTLALNTRGSITYNQGGGYTSLGNFILDQTGADPGTISKGFGNPNLNTGATMFAPYIEDTWRIKNNLSLTAGLRYEYWGALANALPYPSFDISQGVGVPHAIDPSFATDPAKFNSLYSFKQVPDKRNFAPRLGIAYTPRWGRFLFGDGKTTIRAGYGIFYDGLFSNIVDLSAASQPNTFGGQLPSQSGPGTPAASTFPGITPTLDATFLIQSMASRLHNPMTQQWNVDVQRELPLGLIMTLAYVGTKGDNLFANQDFNPGVDFWTGGNYLNPNFGEIGLVTNAANSRYDSAQVEVERKISSGLILRASYTYSKFMDDSSEIFTTTGLSSYSQDLLNQRSDWGPSTFDQRHRFTVAYSWKIPYIRRNAFLRALTDQWRWSGIAKIVSGTPNTVSSGFDSVGNGHPNGRPDLVNASAPFGSLGIDAQFYGGDPGTYYDINCFCGLDRIDKFHFVIPFGRAGNVGRNSIHGPGQIYFDTAIQRDFPIHFWKLDNHLLQFRVDLFNAFNHPNLYTPSYDMFDSNFNNSAMTISGGRQIKLWLKYTF